MNILVLTSRKNEFEFELYLMPEEKQVIKGSITEMGQETAVLTYFAAGKTVKKIVNASGYKKAIECAGAVLVEEKILKDVSEIDAVGHRVVHGGEKFLSQVLIDNNVLEGIRDCIELAPLHNPYNLECITAAMKIYAGKRHVAVFDTAFHSSMPEFVKRYAIPPEYYKIKNIHKYGFHGISHEYAVEHVSTLLGMKKEDLNMISCHLGKGGSINAIRGGKSFDISMGFTPNDGLIMSTRSGEIDNGAVLHLLKTEASPAFVEMLLNTRSGFLGLTGISDSLAELLPLYDSNPEVRLAVEMYVYRIRKYIGAYLLNLGHIEALTFTGGVGMNSPFIRSKICENLERYGIELDREKNELAVGGEARISKGEIKIFVIPKREKMMIARRVYGLMAENE